MTDVFVSYSRHDGEFVRELHAFLTGAGRDVWVDWEDIPPASMWAKDIDDSIDAAESIVFVVSPSSLGSEYCAEELRHAAAGGKRVVPIAIDGADPEAAPTALRQLNWIWCRETDDREAAFAALGRALDTDLEWSRAHTRLLVRAVEWDERRDASLLLRGRDLDDAEHRLTTNAGKKPRPTELQQQYVHASRRGASHRLRLLLGGAVAALAVSVAFGVVALLQRNTANERARIAESQALSLRSVDALATAPASALRDAVAAFETSPTREAKVALRRAILANPVDVAIPAAKRPEEDVDPVLAFSGDGKRLLGLTPAGTLRLWRSTNGRDTLGRTRAGLAALGSGGRVLSARGSTVRLVRGKATTVRHLGRRVVGVGFAGPKALALVAGGGTAAVHDVAAGSRVRLKAPKVTAFGAVFSADGTRVVTLGSATRVWDTRTGRLVATLPHEPVASISRDGRFVVTGGLGPRELWSVSPRKRVARLPDDASKAVFSPAGDLVVTIGIGGDARIWRTANGRLAGTLQGYRDPGLDQGVGYTTSFSPDAAFSPDGRLVAVANGDGVVRVWELETRRQVGAVHAGWVNALAFAPLGGRLAAMTWDGDVTIARVPASMPLRAGLRPVPGCPAFDPRASPDGRLVAAPVPGGAGLWRIDGRRVRVLRPPAKTRFARTAGAFAFSGDGRTAAASAMQTDCTYLSGLDRFGAAAWRLDRGAPLSRVWAENGIALDERGTLLGAGNRAWRTATGKPIPPLDRLVALGPDGKHALVARGRTTAVVEVPSGRPVAVLDDAGRLATAGSSSVTAELSPDGDRVVTYNGGVVRLWDGRTGAQIARLDPPNAYVTAFAFADGGRTVQVRFQESAAVHDAATGKRVVSHAGPLGALSDDGSLGLVLRADGGLDVVALKTGTRVTLQTDTALTLTSATFGPTPGLIVAGDANGDVHVVHCAVCAPDDELLRDARATLERVAKAPKAPPISGSVA